MVWIEGTEKLRKKGNNFTCINKSGWLFHTFPSETRFSLAYGYFEFVLKFTMSLYRRKFSFEHLHLSSRYYRFSWKGMTFRFQFSFSYKRGKSGLGLGYTKNHSTFQNLSFARNILSSRIIPTKISWTQA